MHAPGVAFGGPPPVEATNAMFVPTWGRKLRCKNSVLILEVRSKIGTGKICPVLTNRQAAQPTLRLYSGIDMVSRESLNA
jgi:hypothetical protein